MTAIMTSEQRSWKIFDETRKSNADNHLIKTLLDQGDVDFNIGVNSDRDSMMTFAVWHRNTEAVKLLAQAGAPVNANITRKKPFPPLFRAIQNQDLSTAQVLLHYGANIDQEDAYKNTPVMHAIEQKDYEMVHYLLLYGAKLDGKNIWDETPFSLAQKTEKQNIIDLVHACKDNTYRKKALQDYFNKNLISKKELPRKKAAFKKHAIK